ncbi:MAG TPA: hypothetical protein VJ183_14020 [Chloroflexia bacterium]|nr:hypothetical protein [Chloroflexia bacterium]
MDIVERKVESTVVSQTRQYAMPVGFIPTPTNEYRVNRKVQKATVQPGKPQGAAALPVPIPPIPVLVGPRVLLWKQDPSVSEIGVRKAFLPGLVIAGPRDARITIQGLSPVTPNVFGDFIQTPDTDAFDAVHTFAVVRQTLTMYQRAMGGSPLPWQWNSATNTDPLQVFPHGLPNTMNAFYQRNIKSLKFGDFIPPGTPPGPRVFTCRSFDIVAHETGHAILDGIKPGWLLMGNPPQTGGLHESFGDLTAIFLSLSQFDQVEAIIAQTKADLHSKVFLADVAEQFGLALGRPTGLRNADNNLKLSETGNEVHAISQVFTGGIYDVLADIFAFERKPATRDDAAVLHAAGQYLCSLVLRAIIASPATGATYADVVNLMLTISLADGKPVEYRNSIRNQFSIREVVVSSTPLTADFADTGKGEINLKAGFQDDPDAAQDRSTCCGTMQLEEYMGGEELFTAELDALRAVMSNGNLHSNGNSPRKRRK